MEDLTKLQNQAQYPRSDFNELMFRTRIPFLPALKWNRLKSLILVSTFTYYTAVTLLDACGLEMRWVTVLVYNCLETSKIHKIANVICSKNPNI